MFFKALSWLSNPFVAGLFSGVLMCILVFIEGWMTDKETSRDDYMKLFVCTTVIVIAMIYINRFMCSSLASTYIKGGVRSPASSLDYDVGTFDIGGPDF